MMPNIQAYYSKLHIDKYPSITFHKLENLSIAFMISSMFCRIMKLPPDHYKGPHATSKGHAPLLIPVPPWEIVNKPMNMDSAIMVT